jgi:hypothetical protein
MRGNPASNVASDAQRQLPAKESGSSFFYFLIRRGGRAGFLLLQRRNYCALAVPGKAKTVSVPPSDV